MSVRQKRKYGIIGNSVLVEEFPFCLCPLISQTVKETETDTEGGRL